MGVRAFAALAHITARALVNLANRLNRLPFPLLTLLDYMTQAWKRKVEGMYQGLLTRSPTKKSTPSGYDLFVNEVNRGTPARLLHVNRM